MDFLDKIRDAYDNLAAKTSRLAVTILGIILLLFVCALIALGVHSCNQNRIGDVKREDFKTEDEFIPPSNIKLTEDYYFSREQKECWSQEEIEKWFSNPNTVNMNELKQANDALVDEIIGAAP
ncbi:MAG: hypothetical protein J5817_10775 [Treponema sp.]|nr:hypothetical protein [Treponema sp.]